MSIGKINKRKENFTHKLEIIINGTIKKSDVSIGVLTSRLKLVNLQCIGVQ